MPESEYLKWVVREHWKGAVIALDTLIEAPDADQNALMNESILTAYNWFMQQ
jgi:hypothetical protein